MNTKFALCLAPVVLASCVIKQPNVRRDVPNAGQPMQAQTNVQQQAPTPPPVARPIPVTAPAAPVRTVSPQFQRAIEDTVSCRVPLSVDGFRERLEKEGVVALPPKETKDGLVYRPRTPLSVFGMPVKDILFSGNDESDSGKLVSATVEGNVQEAVKAVAANGLRPKKIAKTGNYGMKTKNGSFTIIAAKTGTIFDCSVGWD
jgi:hypothetical protein